MLEVIPKPICILLSQQIRKDNSKNQCDVFYNNLVFYLENKPFIKTCLL